MTENPEQVETKTEQVPETTEVKEPVPLVYPRKAEIYLTLSLSIPDSQQDNYIFASPDRSPVLQIGFLADLFDLLNNDANLGVLRINGNTHEQIKKTLGASYNQ